MKAFIIFIAVYLVAAFVHWDIEWLSINGGADRLGLIAYLVISGLLCVPAYATPNSTDQEQNNG